MSESSSVETNDVDGIVGDGVFGGGVTSIACRVNVGFGVSGPWVGENQNLSKHVYVHKSLRSVLSGRKLLNFFCCQILN